MVKTRCSSIITLCVWLAAWAACVGDDASPPPSGSSASTGAGPSSGTNASTSAGSGGSSASSSSATTGSGAGGNGPCDAAGLVLCDDFEGGVVGMEPDPRKWWPRDPNQPGTPPLIDDSRAHSGSHSFKITGGNPEIMLTHPDPLPSYGITNNDVYVRVWMNPAISSADHSGHCDYIEAGPVRFGDAGEEVRFGASLQLLDVNIQPGNECNGEKTQRSNGLVDMGGGNGLNLPADTWSCVELHFAGTEDGQMDVLRVWVNGEPLEELTVEGFNGICSPDWMPDLDFIKIGAQNFSAQAGEIWYDDVAIGTQPIGCNEGG